MIYNDLLIAWNKGYIGVMLETDSVRVVKLIEVGEGKYSIAMNLY